MAGTNVKRFRAVLEPAANGLGWVIARVPFDIGVAWKKKIRLRVKVEICGQLFRTSLFADPVQGGHYILVNKRMQQAAEAKAGAMIELTIEPDLEEREAVLTPEFEGLLKQEKPLARWFSKQSPSMRREIGKWLGAVKTPESRRGRAEQLAERLLLTMEDEKVLPPILEAAFRSNPAARKGWEAMTPTRRSSSLLAIFYYQSPEARDRRVAKLVEEAIEVARRKRPNA